MTTLPLPTAGLLIRVNPSAGAHRVAVRAGVSVAVPLLVLWLTGRLAWSPYAAFGSFASLYGRDLAHLARLRMQLQAGAALTLAVTIGTAVGCSPGRRWLAVLAVTCCAAAGSLASDRLRWHPAGPLFIVFGSAALATRPMSAGDIPVAFAVAASAALLAAAIGTAGRLRPGSRPATARQAIPGPASARPGWQWRQATRYAVAVLLAGAAATVAGIGHPYWSMVAAVAAVTGADTTARITRAIQRVAGTLAGVLAAAGILAPHLPVPVLIAVIAVLQAATELCIGRNYGLAVIFLTPLALAMGTLAQPVGTWTLLHDRAIETVLGAVIGAAIALAAHARPRGRAVTQARSANALPERPLVSRRVVDRVDGLGDQAGGAAVRVVGRPAGVSRIAGRGRTSR
ncbi:MAG TPA: FUSC family protein [Trebonia sp.]|nr:FUSC family protein [Trebonia sp.]